MQTAVITYRVMVVMCSFDYRHITAAVSDEPRGDEMSTWYNYSAKTFGGVKGRQTDSGFPYAPPMWCDGDPGCYGRGSREVKAQLSRKECMVVD